MHRYNLQSDLIWTKKIVLASRNYKNFYIEVHFQEYLYTRVGPALMRSHFADWAAHTAAELDYLTREQVIYHATIFVFIVIYKYVI